MMRLASSKGVGMPGLTATFVRHRDRLNEVGDVLARYGFAAWVQRGGGLLEAGVMRRLTDRVVDPEIAKLSAGERLRRALIELGATGIKFGQMLSLRPDVVGPDVADELTKLQATVPADPPGLAQGLVERELGGPVGSLYGSFEAEPFASASVAQVHKATLKDGTTVAVKVLHDGVERRVLEDLDLMQAVATYLEQKDAELAQLRPALLVAEFSEMMRDAIDLSQELINLQRFTANFAEEPDIVIPPPYPELSRRRVLTMSMITGSPFTDRASVEAAGWDVEALVHRAADVYLEMIFRDSLYHADPHPGNFLLPDSTHMAILDFGDVGRLTGLRKRQLEAMVIAAGTQDVDGLIDVIIEMTTPPPSVDLAELRSAIEAWLNRYLLVGVGHLDIAGIISSGMELLREHKLVLPADLALLFRVLLRLQGLGRGVQTEVRVTELLEPYVKSMMAQRFDPRRIGRQIARTTRGWDRLATALPGDIQDILEQIRAGNLGVHFRVHDPDGAIDHLVDGLVASASVLAAAQLVARRAGPLVGPFSVPGIVAAGVGLITWQRLVRRRTEHPSWVSRAREMVEARRPRPAGP
jgi:ubiquinone biosynthesis protein